MTETRNDWQLFGYDLGRLRVLWRQGWAEAAHWPLFAWLSPEPPIRVIAPDGRPRLQPGARCAPADPPDYTAVVVPEELCLSSERRLPLMSRPELEQALALEAHSVSPFPPEQLVWGWRSLETSDATQRVRLVVASRAHVEAHLARLGTALTGQRPEAWAGERRPVVLHGFGEAPRAADIRRQRHRNLGLLGLALLLVLAIAATPVWQARQRHASATASLGLLQHQAAEALAQRDALGAARERLRQYRALTADRLEPLALLETLSERLEDDVSLNRLDIREGTVRLSGTANNAAALMEQLGRQPGFSNVRAPTAISRQRGGDKEVFVIELTLGEEATP